MQLRGELKQLYLGSSRRAQRFRVVMLVLEVAILTFFIASSFARQSDWISLVELAIAVILLLDFAARWAISESTRHYFSQLSTWADVIVLATLVAPLFVDNLLFLRVLRAVRLFRSYHLLRDLRRQFTFVRKNSEAIEAAVNLIVFMFITSALVYVLEAGRHEKINNLVDALYFTVSTLTTTGFGDIVFTDPAGRLLSIFIMLAGVGLFLRLVQTIFRPSRVIHECPACGLSRHEPDSIHCRHCGLVLHIKSEGIDT
jgi:voltage-gated potassium channel